MKGSLRVVLILMVVVCLALMAMGASVPQIINYQGSLMDKSVPPKPVTGTVNMTFNVYSSATGSNPIWSEAWSSTATPANPVIVNTGGFNVMLGSLSPFPDTFFAQHQKTFLGIKIGTDSEMLPRQQFASVGYSFAAGNGIPRGGIIMWSGDVTQLPFGWALCNGGNGTPNLQDRFIVGAGPGYVAGAGAKNPTEYILNLNHSHTINDHTHAGWTDAQGSHQHSGTTGNNSSSSNRSKTNDLMAVAENTHTHNFTTDWQGSHTHNVATGGASNRGTDTQLNSAQDIRPPYYALAFIMKL